MKQKKKPGRLASLLILGLVLILALGTVPVQAKSITWETVNPYIWSNSENDRFYCKEDALYRIIGDQEGEGQKLASWKLTDNQYLSLEYASNNRLYVGVRVAGPDTKGGPLYCVDIRTGKSTRAISACKVVCAGGQYLYGFKTHVADPWANPHPLYRWKISGNRMKLAGKVGDRISNAQIVGKKVYYASYGKDGVRNMTVFQSNLNGSGRKKLFSLKAKGSNGTARMVYVEDGIISAYVIDEILGKSTEYEYNIKTGKLTARD